MKKERQIYEIKHLILKSLHNKLNEQEQEKLSVWRGEREENDVLFQKLSALGEKRGGSDFQRYQMAVESQDWERIRHRVYVRRRQRFVKHWLPYVAVVLLFIGMWGYGWYEKLQVPEQPLPVLETQAIVHNTTRAILKLPAGKQIVLDAPEQTDTALLQQYGIVHQDTVLSYEKAVAVAEWHTIEVPRGGEYLLTLADGSKIWLNADSELKFPACFEGDERKVYLERGEAYFEVAADAGQPFYVEVKDMKVKVIGTEFNVMAYPRKPVIATTLVNGAVEVITPQTALSVKPNEQAVYACETGELSKKQVDVHLFTSWKNGIFEFKGMPLEEVAEVLSRWYDVDFVFEDPQLKQEHFTGVIQRSKSLEFILDIIQETRMMAYRIVDKTVIFTKK